MTTLKWLASVSLAIATLPALRAEPHCPGNVTSLRLRLVQRSLIVVPVEINHIGPADFMVDTGAQITTVDPVLASAFHFKAMGHTGGSRSTHRNAPENYCQEFLEGADQKLVPGPDPGLPALAYLDAKAFTG